MMTMSGTGMVHRTIEANRRHPPPRRGGVDARSIEAAKPPYFAQTGAKRERGSAKL